MQKITDIIDVLQKNPLKKIGDVIFLGNVAVKRISPDSAHICRADLWSKMIDSNWGGKGYDILHQEYNQCRIYAYLLFRQEGAVLHDSRNFAYQIFY